MEHIGRMLDRLIEEARTGVVKASDLGDRWDAGFHLDMLDAKHVMGSVSSMAAGLRDKMSSDEAVQKASAVIEIAKKHGIGNALLSAMATLTRGSAISKSPNLASAIKQYPYESMAMVLRHLKDLKKELLAKKADIEKDIARITGSNR